MHYWTLLSVSSAFGRLNQSRTKSTHQNILSTLYITKRMNCFSSMVFGEVHITEAAITTESHEREPENSSGMSESTTFDICVIPENPSASSTDLGSIA